MDDILSQIIAYAPDRIDTETKARALVQGPRNMYNQGQLVSPSVDGSRPGYSGERVYTTDTPHGKRSLDLTKEQNKWFNKTHKNNPNSRFYKKDWSELAGKKSDILDSYDNELAREKPPKGYITTKEFSKKYDFPIYEKRQYGPVTKAESNFINNALMKTIGEKEASKGRRNLLTKKFITDTLEPKQFETLLDLGDGKKSVKKVNYIKDSPKLAKKLRTYLDSPFVQVKTRENMAKILKNNNIKTLFNRGDYKGLVKALENVKGLTNAERANALLRISQAMSGVNFRDFEHGLKPNKPSANKIFRGLEKAKWGDPYADAYRDLKRNTIKDAIGDKYFTKSYGSFLDDAKKALNKSGIDTRALNLDLNELTGLSNAYKNKTFNSSQFINFMDSNFNSEQHASMIKEYGRHETKLQNVLKGKKPNFDEAAKITKEWRTWKKDWFDRLDSRMKTDQIKSILPDFKLGADAATKAFSTQRLEEFRKANFPIEEEIKKMKYVKTFGTKKSMSETPILKEVASGDSKAMERIKKQLIALCPKGKASGGRIGFNTAGAVSSRATCGARFLEARIKDGKGSVPQRKLMADIIAAGSKLKKFGASMLNPLELLNPKNLIGPQALALMGAFEMGDITYDAINNNKPIKEALGDNWILRYMTPYNQAEEQVKAVEEANIKGSPAMQNYMKKVKIEAEYEREYKKLKNLKTSLQTGSKSPEAIKKVEAEIQNQQAVVDKVLNNYKQFAKDTSVKGANGMPISTLESGKQDFEKAFGTIIDKRQGGEFVAGDKNQSLMKTYIEGKSEDKYINTAGDWADSGDLSHITGSHPYKYKIDLGKDQSRNMSETERKTQELFPFEKGSIKADYTKPTYKDFNYIPQKLPDDRRQAAELGLTEIGILPPRTSLSQLSLSDGYSYLDFLTDDYNYEQKAKQGAMYPGYGGTQEPAKYSPFAEGGITGLRSKYEYKK